MVCFLLVVFVGFELTFSQAPSAHVYLRSNRFVIAGSKFVISHLSFFVLFLVTGYQGSHICHYESPSLD